MKTKTKISLRWISSEANRDHPAPAGTARKHVFHASHPHTEGRDFARAEVFTYLYNGRLDYVVHWHQILGEDNASTDSFVWSVSDKGIECRVLDEPLLEKLISEAWDSRVALRKRVKKLMSP